MLWLPMIWGFLTSTTASVIWNSDMLRIIADADMIAMFAVCRTSVLVVSIGG
jgi:hypothetical protein